MKKKKLNGIKADVTRSDIPIFLASNEVPPPFFLYDKDDYINTGAEARIKIEKINNWKTILFAFIIEKNEFIPLRAAEAHNRIEDFKYIIKYT